MCNFETHCGSGFCRQMLVDQVFSGRDNKGAAARLHSPCTRSLPITPHLAELQKILHLPL